MSILRSPEKNTAFAEYTISSETGEDTPNEALRLLAGILSPREGDTNPFHYCLNQYLHTAEVEGPLFDRNRPMLYTDGTPVTPASILAEWQQILTTPGQQVDITVYDSDIQQPGDWTRGMVRMVFSLPRDESSEELTRDLELMIETDTAEPRVWDGMKFLITQRFYIAPVMTEHTKKQPPRYINLPRFVVEGILEDTDTIMAARDAIGRGKTSEFLTGLARSRRDSLFREQILHPARLRRFGNPWDLLPGRMDNQDWLQLSQIFKTLIEYVRRDENRIETWE